MYLCRALMINFLKKEKKIDLTASRRGRAADALFFKRGETLRFGLCHRHTGEKIESTCGEHCRPKNTGGLSSRLKEVTHLPPQCLWHGIDYQWLDGSQGSTHFFEWEGMIGNVFKKVKNCSAASQEPASEITTAEAKSPEAESEIKTTFLQHIRRDFKARIHWSWHRKKGMRREMTPRASKS